MFAEGARQAMGMKSRHGLLVAGILIIALVLSGCTVRNAGGANQRSGSLLQGTPQGSAANQGVQATPGQPGVVQPDVAKVTALVNSAAPILREGLVRSSGGADSIYKVEGASVVQDEARMWLWVGTRAVDRLNSGAAALLSSDDGGKSWKFVGRMLAYPPSLEDKLRAAQIYDIEVYLQSATFRRDENGILVGDFPLSAQAKSELVAKAKTETWLTRPEEVAKSRAADLGIPSLAILTPENDYFKVNIKAANYYVFTRPVTDGSSVYYVARVSR